MVCYRKFVLVAFVALSIVGTAPLAHAQTPTPVPVTATTPETDEAPFEEAVADPAMPVEVPPAAPVVAPVVAKSPAAIRLINLLIDVLAAMLLIIAPYFAHRLIALFEKKTNIKLAPEQKAKIDTLLDKGIAYADEQSHKATKKGEEKLTMSERLEYGAGYVMDLADKADAKGWTIAKVGKMIEARLQETRVTNGTSVTPVTPA